MVGFSSLFSKEFIITNSNTKDCHFWISCDYNFKKNKLLMNHILPIFKLRSREKQFIHINNLIAEIKGAKAIEKEVANSKKDDSF